jgi:hypothetical protein
LSLVLRDVAGSTLVGRRRALYGRRGDLVLLRRLSRPGLVDPSPGRRHGLLLPLRLPSQKPRSLQRRSHLPLRIHRPGSPSWTEVVDVLDVDPETLELAKDRPLVVEVQPGVLEQGDGEVLVSLLGVDSKGLMKCFRDGVESGGEDSLCCLSLAKEERGGWSDPSQGGKGSERTHLLHVIDSVVDLARHNTRAGFHAFDCTTLGGQSLIECVLQTMRVHKISARFRR